MPHPLYLIEAQHPRLGRWFIETDRDSNSRAHAISLIHSGEVDPIKVLEVNEDEGTCLDVTADIIAEAEAISVNCVDPIDFMNPAFSTADHLRDLRKHEVA